MDKAKSARFSWFRYQGKRSCLKITNQRFKVFGCERANETAFRKLKINNFPEGFEMLFNRWAIRRFICTFNWGNTPRKTG